MWLDPYTEDNLARDQRKQIRENARIARPFQDEKEGAAPLFALLQVGLAFTSSIRATVRSWFCTENDRADHDASTRVLTVSQREETQ